MKERDWALLGVRREASKPYPQSRDGVSSSPQSIMPTISRVYFECMIVASLLLCAQAGKARQGKKGLGFETTKSMASQPF